MEIGTTLKQLFRRHIAKRREKCAIKSAEPDTKMLIRTRPLRLERSRRKSNRRNAMHKLTKLWLPGPGIRL